ncbi:unnamed protein product [Haemonchus placei]|uniref:Uncharacterized protein n=1 Tax=Haemonchus placei TaxID=6290 RepID=A0A3P7W4V7_HAEPC|nr:unnamed protein product [Haemonchus placei]
MQLKLAHVEHIFAFYRCFLASLSEKRAAFSLFQHFNVVSTQSTAKPGCVLKVGEISGAFQASSRLLMLHVLPKRFLNSGSNPMRIESPTHVVSSLNREGSCAFIDRHFVVIVECEDDCEYFVLFLLLIYSQTPQLVELTVLDEHFITGCKFEVHGISAGATSSVQSLAISFGSVEYVVRRSEPEL